MLGNAQRDSPGIVDECRTGGTGQDAQLQRVLGCDGGDVDDPPPAALHHAVEHGIHELHGTQQAGIETRLPLRRVDRTIVLGHGRRGTGPDQNVRGRTGGENPRTPLGQRVIRHDRYDADACSRGDFLSCRAQASFTPRGDDQVYAFACQRERRRLPHTGAAAIDDRLTASNAEIHPRLLSPSRKPGG